MQHSYVGEMQDSYEFCLITNAINHTQLQKEYWDPACIEPKDAMVLIPHFKTGAKKTPVKEMKEFVNNELIGIVKDFSMKYLLVTNADYYKLLSGQSKADADIGYVRSAFWDESIKVIYLPAVSQIFYDPVKVREKIRRALDSVMGHRAGLYEPPGDKVIETGYYPMTLGEIKYRLEWLYQMNMPLTMDIEAASLKANTAGIATVSFAWNQNEGIAFPVDIQEIPGATEAPYTKMVVNNDVRRELARFLIRFRNKLIFHNIAFDAYVLIYQLFMEDITDTEGMLFGQDVLLKDWDCTKLISYLATNTCAGNTLSLKEQAQEYLGNWAEGDIKDITKIPLKNLLIYNLKDSLGTWFVYNKHRETLIQDEQEELYQTLFKKSTRDIIEMQLTGLPVNMERVLEVEKLLSVQEAQYLKQIHENEHVQEFSYTLKEDWVESRNSKLKVKRVSMDDAPDLVLNPNSPLQMQKLLYTQLGLPIISFTDSKQPSVDGDTLEKLSNHTKDKRVLDLLQALRDFAGVSKITSSFIPALKNAIPGKDGWHYLCGNFNLGGTLSGRLSSSDPNLQNLPAGSDYGKLIKSCFQAPPGWLMVGLDFASLEDRISALTTKDPNKLRVYLDGFDGHSLRAFSYWSDKMPKIKKAFEKKDLSGKFYKVVENGETNYYHESDLPSEVKRSLGIQP